MAERRVFGLTDTLTFGKHKGQTVQEVVRINPNYLTWAINNIEWFDLDAEARKSGQRAIDARFMRLAYPPSWFRQFDDDSPSNDVWEEFGQALTD